jgi:multiple sugar transport system substrate-binding protein
MRQLKKNWWCIAVVIVVLAFLAAAAGIVFAEREEEGVTVKTIAFGEGWVENLAKRVDQFYEKTGIKVEYEMTSFNEAHTKMMLDIQNSKKGKSKPAYDFYYMDIPWKAEFVDTGVMLDLTDRATPEFDRDDFDQYYLKAIGQVGDRIYMYPVLSVTRVICYRKDLFEDSQIKREYRNKYGMALKPPDTWEEFNQIAAFFHAHPSVKWGATASARRGTTALSEFVDRYFGLGGVEFNYYPDQDAWEPLLTSSKAVEALHLYADLAPYTVPGSSDAIWDLAAKSFAAGDVAIMIMWDAFAPLFTNPEQSKVADDVGFALGPGTHLGGWGICINKYSEHTEEAYKFLEWATGESAWDQTYEGPGMIPRKSIMNDPRILAKHPWVATHAENIRISGLRSEARVVGKEVDIGPTLVPEPQYEMIVGTAVNAAFTGTKPVEQALIDAERQVIELLKESGYKVVDYDRDSDIE